MLDDDEVEVVWLGWLLGAVVAGWPLAGAVLVWAKAGAATKAVATRQAAICFFSMVYPSFFRLWSCMRSDAHMRETAKSRRGSITPQLGSA
jgi:hypothetical protein